MFACNYVTLSCQWLFSAVTTYMSPLWDEYTYCDSVKLAPCVVHPVHKERERERGEKQEVGGGRKCPSLSNASDMRDLDKLTERGNEEKEWKSYCCE